MEQWNLKGVVVCNLSFSAAALKSLHWNFPEGFVQHCNDTFLFIYLFIRLILAFNCNLT